MKIRSLILSGILLTGVSLSAVDFPTDEVEIVEASDNKSLESVDLDSEIENVKASIVIEDIEVEEENSGPATINLDQLEEATSTFGESENVEEPSGFDMNEETKSSSNPYSQMALKSYGSVKYYKPYQWFDIIKSNENSFNKIMRRMKITRSQFNDMKNSDSSNEAVVLNALYYDFVMKRPDIAENFYLIFPDLEGKIDPFYNRVLLANYLIRTKRVDMVEDILGRGNCMNTSRSKENICWFYLGSAYYLTTGKSKNFYLKKAKRSIKKAGKIYNKRKKK